MRPSATLLFWNVELCACTLLEGPSSHCKICLTNYLLGGLLLLLLLLLGIGILLRLSLGGLLNGSGLLSLGLLLDGDEQANDVLGLHVVLIDLELTEDVLNLSLGHLVSPGFQSVLEHLGVNLALHVVGLESLDNQ